MSTGQYGLFLGAESAAMLIAMALMALRPIPGNRQYRVFAGSMALTCGLYIAAMAAQGFWACTVLYALNAFFNTVYNMFLYPSIMRATPAAYQGRVIALFAALSNGGIALSMVAYGALADAWGAGAVCLSAQLPVVGFYARYGFKPCGEVYDEEGVPHRMMKAAASEINLEGSCGGAHRCEGCAGDCSACESREVQE